jgi:hypothetical protein
MFNLNCLGNFFKFFDQYGEPVRIMYRGDTSFTTLLGALLSLSIYVFFIIIFIYLYIDLENKTNYTFTAFSKVQFSPPYFEFTAEKSLLNSTNYPDRAFFFHAFTFKNRKTGKYYKKEELDRLFFIEIYDSVNNKTSGINKDIGQSEVFPCKQIYKNTNFTEIFNSSLINNAFCINETVIKVEGDFTDTIFRFNSIKLKACSDSKLESKPICANDSEFSEAKKTLSVTFLYSDSKLMPNIPDEFLKFFLNYFTVDLSSLSNQKFDIYLSKNTLKSYDNVYNQFTYFSIRPFIALNKIRKHESLPSKSYMSFYFRSDYHNAEYIRSYKTFLDFIGQLGGIWKVLLVVGGLIVIPLNAKLLNMALANDLFNLILPQNIDKIDDYDGANRKSSYYLPHKLISSNGKNPLEAKMTIGYYKFQRNKGVYYSMGQTFCSVFLFCFRTKTVKEMDEIYMESKKRLFNQLNIADVLKFSLQFSIIKNNILDKNEIMFRHQADLVIRYSDVKINHNNQKNEEKNFLDEEEEHEIAADLKEKDFLAGIRGLKNKVSGLDDKIDINLLKLFQTDGNFGSYCQTYSINELFIHYFCNQEKLLRDNLNKIK